MSAATAAPSRSQRMDALERANRVRSERAKAKAAVRSFALTFGELLELECCQSAKVWDLVICIPKVGRSKAGRAFSRIGIDLSRRVDGLSSRQRTELMAWVAEREQVRSFVAGLAAARGEAT